MEIGSSSGSKIIKVNNGVHFFRSQLESCIEIDDSVECSTPIEFECVVDIK